MSIPYRTRCVLKRLGIGILILAVAFVVVALYLFADFEQYVVYTRQGATLVVGTATSIAFLPRGSILTIRFLISINRVAIYSKLT